MASPRVFHRPEDPEINQERNAAEAAKGKFKGDSSRVSGDGRTCRSGVGGCLMVYSNNKREKVGDDSIRNPLVATRRVIPNAASNPKKSKGKYGICAKENVGRRALADVSNVQGSSAKDACRSRTMNPVGSGNKMSTLSSKKSFTGMMQGNTCQGNANLRTTRKVSKDIKAFSVDQRTRISQGNRASLVLESRTARKPLIPVRKSLPVPKRVNQADTTNPKVDAGSSGIPKGKVSVKSALSKNAVTQSNNMKGHLWSNRMSDGFIQMGKVGVNLHAFSRKSSKPPVKTKAMAYNAPRTSNVNYKTGQNMLASASVSSQKDSENGGSVVADDTSHGQHSSDGGIHPRSNSLDLIARKNSSRRKSYTSSLLERSKFLKGCDEALEQEKLPSIDNKSNQLEVSEYIDEIYEYYWVTEAQNPSLENYMLVQSDVTPHMRGILINWLIEVHFKFNLMQETLYLTVTLLDQYLSKVAIRKSKMQLVGLTALLLASKYEDFWHPSVKDLISISVESYTRDQMLGMEKLILKMLKFRLNSPTPYVFMMRFLKAAHSDTKLEHLSFYLIDLCLVEYEALAYKPSLLCASAIYLARITLQMTPAWTQLLCKHAHYEVSHMRDCAEMILRFHKGARTGQLRVTYEKYLRPDLSCVASIKPLEILPI